MKKEKNSCSISHLKKLDIFPADIVEFLHIIHKNGRIIAKEAIL